MNTPSHTGVLISLEKGGIKPSSLGLLTAATPCAALIFGTVTPQLRETLARFGADRVICMGAAEKRGEDFPELKSRTLARAMETYGFTALLGNADLQTMDLFARTAAQMDLPLAQDCLGIDLKRRTLIKSSHSGKLTATLQAEAPVFMATIRPNALPPLSREAAGILETFAPEPEDPGRLEIVQRINTPTPGPDLTEARVVVTGGRGMGSARAFDLLHQLAPLVNGAVGASRSAVDAGFAPYALQVGQTGKTVSPDLYIAWGVSGAVQHFAGMRTSKVIVAVNQDENAQIFNRCDIGIRGDLFEVLPVLIEKLKAGEASSTKP